MSWHRAPFGPICKNLAVPSKVDVFAHGDRLQANAWPAYLGAAQHVSRCSGLRAQCATRVAVGSIGIGGITSLNGGDRVHIQKSCLYAVVLDAAEMRVQLSSSKSDLGVGSPAAPAISPPGICQVAGFIAP